MGDSTRSGWSFAAGLMVGGAAALWASFAWLLPALDPTLTPHLTTAQPVAPAPASQLAPSSATSGDSRTVDPAAAQACGLEPVLAPASARDGRFTVDAASAGEPPRPRAYLAAARDAAREGRWRDSEVALLVACRLAAAKSPLVSVPVADVQSLLGQRYLEAAGLERHEAVRAALLERAEGLFERSLLAYTVVLGSQASKSRLAARRMAALGQLRERHDRFAAAAGPDGALPPPAAGTLAILGAGPQPPWAGLAPPATGDPASSAANAALIRSDPELAQLEADMARLAAQAAQVARDPQGLRQRSEQALAQRAAQCRDKPCLLRWYAQRKRELFAEF